MAIREIERFCPKGLEKIGNVWKRPALSLFALCDLRGGLFRLFILAIARVRRAGGICRRVGRARREIQYHCGDRPQSQWLNRRNEHLAPEASQVNRPPVRNQGNLSAVSAISEADSYLLYFARPRRREGARNHRRPLDRGTALGTQSVAPA